ncbi:MAG: hypothetical protein HRU14_07990, partial [Planctomycetes bacterium]|nr:hypothetical protein [Planctomycetota bacterium]
MQDGLFARGCGAQRPFERLAVRERARAEGEAGREPLALLGLFVQAAEQDMEERVGRAIGTRQAFDMAKKRTPKKKSRKILSRKTVTEKRDRETISKIETLGKDVVKSSLAQREPAVDIP